MAEPIPEFWWESAFERTRNHSEITGHPRGKKTMLVIVAYDITDPRRLKHVADCCKNYGIRVQYSIFECHLEARHFDDLWEKLKKLIDKKEDRIVAYPISADNSRKIRTCGTVVTCDHPVAYIY